MNKKRQKLSKGRFFYNMTAADAYERKLKKAGRKVERWSAGHGDMVAYVIEDKRRSKKL